MRFLTPRGDLTEIFPPAFTTSNHKLFYVSLTQALPHTHRFVHDFNSNNAIIIFFFSAMLYGELGHVFSTERAE